MRNAILMLFAAVTVCLAVGEAFAKRENLHLDVLRPSWQQDMHPELQLISHLSTQPRPCGGVFYLPRTA
jgi:hypothetical protein